MQQKDDQFSVGGEWVAEAFQRRRTQVPPGYRFDYKDVEMLRKFISERGKILPARQTGLTARQQRDMRRAVMRARCLALLPYTSHD